MAMLVFGLSYTGDYGGRKKTLKKPVTSKIVLSLGADPNNIIGDSQWDLKVIPREKRRDQHLGGGVHWEVFLYFHGEWLVG